MSMAIPCLPMPKDYYQIKCVNSGFVNLTETNYFDVKPKYISMGFKYATPNSYVRQEVCELLYKAQKSLPNGLKFRIWDSWRPFNLQMELYSIYSRQIKRDYCTMDMTDDEEKEIISQFISYPNNDRMYAPVHTTGGAIDLTLIDSDGVELDMGTAFDSFSQKTQTDYFEKKENDNIIRENRRILYNSMINAGFTNLPSEWWHYDYGDRFWAYYNKKEAIYQGVFTEEELDCI